MNIYLNVQLASIVAVLLSQNLPHANTQSYSQVRLTSTRRNGTYDAYALINNPALANHRLPVYPQQVTELPEEPQRTLPPPTPSTMQSIKPPSAAELTSAVQDAINQGIPIIQKPFSSNEHPAATYSPRQDTLKNNNNNRVFSNGHEAAVLHNGNVHSSFSDTVQQPGDLQHLPSQVHEVAVAASSDDLPPASGHQEPYPDIPSDEYIRDYYQRPTTTPNVATTTECLACKLFHQAFIRNQQQIKVMNKYTPEPSNAIPHTTDSEKTTQRPPVQVPLVQVTQTTPPENKPVRTNFTAPTTNEVFSISDALMPNFQPQQLVHQNNPLPLPGNQLLPSGVQGLPMPLGPVVISQPGFPPSLGNNPSAIHATRKDSLPVNIPQPLQGSIAHGPQLNFAPGGPQGLPPGMVVSQPSVGSPHMLPKPQDSSLPPGMFLMEPNRGMPQGIMVPHGAELNPQLIRQGQQQQPQQFQQDQQQQQPQQFQQDHQQQQQQQQQGQQQHGIRGPMGIHIPIPPKTVPAHSVMAPPMALPPMGPQGPHPTMQPPRRSGGFLDSIRNLFTGGSFTGRARNLDEDGILLEDDEVNVNSSSANGTASLEEVISSQSFNDDSNATEVHYNNGLREKRATDGTNKTTSLLDEVGDFLSRALDRFRIDAQRLTGPFLPSLRNSIRRYLTVTENEDGNPQKKGSFWSFLLNEESTQNAQAAERRDLEQQIHQLLTSDEGYKSTTPGPIEQLRKVSETSVVPLCALEMRDKYCTLDLDYPRQLITDTIKQLAKKRPDNFPCNVTSGRFNIHRLNRIKVGACQSPMQKVQPLRARNNEGIWKIIVNVEICQQTLFIQKCHPSCSTQASKAVGGSRCKEVHAPYQLLAFDSTHGFHEDTFHLPSACWCGL